MGWSGSFGTMAFHIVSLPIRRTPSKEIFRGAPHAGSGGRSEGAVGVSLFSSFASPEAEQGQSGALADPDLSQVAFGVAARWLSLVLGSGGTGRILHRPADLSSLRSQARRAMSHGRRGFFLGFLGFLGVGLCWDRAAPPSGVAMAAFRTWRARLEASCRSKGQVAGDGAQSMTCHVTWAMELPGRPPPDAERWRSPVAAALGRGVRTLLRRWAGEIA
jgi:hypothetical protein